jgi:hypothetical protein
MTAIGQRQFRLWRLFASLTCFAVALALLRWAWVVVESHGGGDFPALCVILAVVLTAAGVGLLFPRVWEFLFYLFAFVLRILGGG